MREYKTVQYIIVCYTNIFVNLISSLQYFNSWMFPIFLNLQNIYSPTYNSINSYLCVKIQFSYLITSRYWASVHIKNLDSKYSIMSKYRVFHLKKLNSTLCLGDFLLSSEAAIGVKSSNRMGALTFRQEN